MVVHQRPKRRSINSTFDNNSLTRGEYRYIVTLSYDGNSISQKVAIIVCTKPEIKSVTATLKANELNPTPKDSGIKYDIKKSGILSTNPMEINGECYINDVIQMQCDLEGGSNYSQGWEYKFNDENPISMQGGIVSHLYDSSGDNKTTDNFQIFYNYKGKYYTNNKEWYKSPDKYRFNFKVYETPTCTPNLTDSADVQWGGILLMCMQEAYQYPWMISKEKEEILMDGLLTILLIIQAPQ